MTLPSSPPITMAQIRAEFGAPAGTPLNQFYQGGPWVGKGGANVNVPSAPPINMLNLLGAAAGGSTSGFLASVSPNSSSGTGSNGYINTSIVTCTTVGQTGSVSFQWFQVSGDTSIGITNPNAATTAFRGNVTGGNSLSGIFACKATDGGSGAVSTSSTIAVNVIFESKGFIP